MTLEARSRDVDIPYEPARFSEESYRDFRTSSVMANDRCWRCGYCFLEKGNLSVIVTLAVGIVGILVRVLAVSPCSQKDAVSNATSTDCNEALLLTARYFIASGLFGFAGGVTNWVAVKMLFHRIPLVYGSGVIPNRYLKIRETIKDVVLAAFFDEGFLDKYVGQKIGQLATDNDAGKRLQTILESPAVEQLIDVKLESLYGQSEGDVLRLIGIDIHRLRPMVKPILLGLAADLAPGITTKLTGSKGAAAVWLKQELDVYMTLRLQEVTREQVSSLLQRVIAKHLGWIVVWGTVFGGVVGVICEAVSISPEY